jgi:hypothetical protein
MVKPNKPYVLYCIFDDGMYRMRSTDGDHDFLVVQSAIPEKIIEKTCNRFGVSWEALLYERRDGESALIGKITSAGVTRYDP